MQNNKTHIFFSHNKREKEIVFLFTIGFACSALTIFALTGTEFSLTLWGAYAGCIASILIILRSLKYREIRAELSPTRCEIYVGETLLSRIHVASMSYSSFGRGGLRIKIATSTPFSERLKLPSLLFHFFGPCIRHAVLSNTLFPGIGDVAIHSATAASQRPFVRIASTLQH